MIVWTWGSLHQLTPGKIHVFQWRYYWQVSSWILDMMTSGGIGRPQDEVLICTIDRWDRTDGQACVRRQAEWLAMICCQAHAGEWSRERSASFRRSDKAGNHKGFLKNWVTGTIVICTVFAAVSTSSSLWTLLRSLSVSQYIVAESGITQMMKLKYTHAIKIILGMRFESHPPKKSTAVYIGKSTW
jgi:hypothetical protein